MVLLVSAFHSIIPAELLERSGSEKARAKLHQIWAVYKLFRVRDKGTSLCADDLHGCFRFPSLVLGAFNASNNNPPVIITSASELFSWTNM